MTGLVLALMLNVTPAECEANREWCICRRYIAKELNRCQERVNNSKYWAQRAPDFTECLIQYEKGKIACLKNDGSDQDG